MLMNALVLLRRENKSKEEYDGIETDNLITLERLKQNQRQDYLKVSRAKTKPAPRLPQGESG